MRSRCHGITLIEVIVVIVILGVLAGIALPRFVGLQRDARVAAVQGAAGALRSAAEMAHAVWLVRNPGMGRVSVTLPDGLALHFWRGYPDGGNCCAPAGIEALIDLSGLSVAYSGARRTRVYVAGAPRPERCSATYLEPANPGDVYEIELDVRGC